MHVALCLFFVFEKMMENGVGQLRMQDNLIRIGYGMAAHRKVRSPCEESGSVFMRASPCVARPHRHCYERSAFAYPPPQKIEPC